ncbi:hypothetical protein [Spongiibacter tropicus]|uniref:hypothetical protein n=1 Tax=Spongiibacter tropicus TaxID=454602 RepID=UPI0035BE6537
MAIPEFNIAISHRTKWDQGYTKAIDYGYMDNLEKGIVGYYQQHASQTAQSPSDSIDMKCLYFDVSLSPSQVQPILQALSNTSCRLTGPKEETHFTSAIFTLSVSINHHKTKVSWNAMECEYDKQFEDIWHQVDRLIPPTSEDYYKEKWGK